MGHHRVTGVIRPFSALVVRQEFAAQTVSRMFDALPAAERPTDPATSRGLTQTIDPDAYDASAPALYVYRLRRGQQEHLGVVGDVSAEAFLDGRVRGHESVQPDRVAALVDHYGSAAVRSELVALLHRGGPSVDAAVAEVVRHRPIMEFTGPDAWEQAIWRVPETMVTVLTDELGRGVLYIADGHHRVAASLTVWHQEGLHSGTGVMCAVFPLDGLRLLAFHRRVSGPIRPDRLFALLAGAFDLSDIAHPEEATGCFALYVDGRWYDATYTNVRPPGAAGLDITILDEKVLEPLLRLDATTQVEITSALSPLAELTAACDEDGGALFALGPPAIEQLIEVADRGEVMPPKTTYFDPKPYAGIFLR